MLEAGWQKGQAIHLHGPLGVGKTRLMLDFAMSKGSPLLNEGQPGDSAVPYLSLSRGFRCVLRVHPDLKMPHEVPAAYLHAIEALAERGLLTLIELQPLDPEATTSLLESIGVAAETVASARFSAELHRYTGGSPLFVLETLKNLFERGSVGT